MPTPEINHSPNSSLRSPQRKCSAKRIKVLSNPLLVSEGNISCRDKIDDDRNGRRCTLPYVGVRLFAPYILTFVPKNTRKKTWAKMTVRPYEPFHGLGITHTKKIPSRTNKEKFRRHWIKESHFFFIIIIIFFAKMFYINFRMKQSQSTSGLGGYF